jgi:hypothetical protein
VGVKVGTMREFKLDVSIKVVGISFPTTFLSFKPHKPYNIPRHQNHNLPQQSRPFPVAVQQNYPLNVPPDMDQFQMRVPERIQIRAVRL